ncbi:hypothetical protein Pmani_014360 [Petrolisthes manimaculis]|uniref:Uncharacterized protein n=1 Tax=Petrolisthes manimaculis TaxID=1843537 RepID=A0AAE1U8F4_9EUCA|nr:hypothetical protein Pmani_014360 [Petrolisthes manimaculis]
MEGCAVGTSNNEGRSAGDGTGGSCIPNTHHLPTLTISPHSPSPNTHHLPTLTISQHSPSPNTHHTSAQSSHAHYRPACDEGLAGTLALTPALDTHADGQVVDT